MNAEAVSATLAEQVALGYWRKTNGKVVAAPLSAIRKRNGDVRLLSDYSHSSLLGPGEGINVFGTSRREARTNPPDGGPGTSDGRAAHRCPVHSNCD